MVTAPFNTAVFNDQVANVNAITRIVLVLPDMLALFYAFNLMYKAMYALLPGGSEKEADSAEFWTLLEQREAALAGGGDGSSLSNSAVDVRARKQARGEFGIN
jgi:hypothetical protein